MSAAFAAAVAAHVAIDALGDVVLARDAYDHVAHGSRAVALGGAMVAACVLTWCIVGCAFAEAFGNRPSLRTALAHAHRSSAGWFVARVVVLTIVVLGAMGIFDALLDAGTIGTIGDVFGGSPALSCGVTIPLAVGAALGARALLGAIVASHRKLVGALVALIALRVRARNTSIVTRVDADIVVLRHLLGTLAKRAGKRAPPPLSI